MKDSYPYVIPKDVPFHREAIPVFGTTERIEFFYKYKRDNEKLYVGTIDKDNLLLKAYSDVLLNSISKYVFEKQFEFENERIVSDFNRRLFPKVCWLADEYFKQGFKYPVSVHYNPRIQRNVIHPGSIRNHIIKLFQQEQPVKCLYFNTGGVKFEFMNSLSVFSKGDLLEYKENLEIELVADHGSIIPHLNLDVTSVNPNIEKWHGFIRTRLTGQEFRVFSNKPIDFLQPWYASKETASIEIIIGDVNSDERDDILCKATILAMLGKSYQSEKLTVTHKILIDTLA
jgi:hypothetical protein